MNKHRGPRIFITGIPASGKSFLAKKLAESTGGIAVFLDHFREDMAKNPQYEPWVNFYWNKDEYLYYTKTSAEEQWQNLVDQSEAFFPAFLQKIEEYKDEEKAVIFECVNLLPHLTSQKINFPGLVLLGPSQSEILERIKREHRWGRTDELKQLEAESFYTIERPRYEKEAITYNYPVFETADDAFQKALELLNKQG